MTREQQIAAEVAARYGVKVQPAAVQVVPTGASAWALPVWDGKMLRYPDADKRKAAVQAAHYRRAKMGAAARAAHESPRMTALQERREAVRILHAEGLWQSEMARRLCVNVSTISTDHQALGLEPIRPPKDAFNSKRSYDVAPQIVARNARIAELAGQGWTADKIGLDVGFSARVVLDVARKLGVEVKRLGRPAKEAKALVAKPTRAAKVPARRTVEIAARRDAVRNLVEQGHYTAEISRLLDVSFRQISDDIRAMGLSPQRGATIAKAKATSLSDARRRQADRRAAVVEQYHAGLTLEAIAANVGAHYRTVRSDLRASGIKPKPQHEALTRAREGYLAQKRVEIAERDLRMRQFVADGLTTHQIAKTLNRSETATRRDLRRLGLSADRGEGMRQKHRAALSLRRSGVERLRAEGASLEDIATTLDVCLATVSKDVRALGLVTRLDRKTFRRAAVARMLADGATIRAMADCLGVSATTISTDIAAVRRDETAGASMSEAA